MIDIGLHRCMTGIHFMYDNYISYITFIEILKELRWRQTQVILNIPTLGLHQCSYIQENYQILN